MPARDEDALAWQRMPCPRPFVSWALVLTARCELMETAWRGCHVPREVQWPLVGRRDMEQEVKGNTGEKRRRRQIGEGEGEGGCVDDLLYLIHCHILSAECLS